MKKAIAIWALVACACAAPELSGVSQQNLIEGGEVPEAVWSSLPACARAPSRAAVLYAAQNQRELVVVAEPSSACLELRVSVEHEALVPSFRPHAPQADPNPVPMIDE